MSELYQRDFTQSGYVWIDLVGPSKQELREIAAKYSLHATSVADCLDPLHLPKSERIGNTTFVIARSFDEHCTKNADSVHELTRKVAIFMGENFLLTVHRHDLDYIRSLRLETAVDTTVPTRFASEPGLVQLMSAILKDAIAGYHAPIDEAYVRLEALEIETFQKNRPRDVLERGYYLRRRASIIERIVRLSAEMTQRLIVSNAAGAPYLQDVKEECESVLFYADELEQYVTNLLSLHLSLQSNRTNDVMRLLTVFSIFFLPLNFLASVYGMNFVHMPGLAHPVGFYASIVVMMAVALALFWYFRRKGWLSRPD